MNVKLAMIVLLLLPAVQVIGQSKVERSPEPVGPDNPAISVSGAVVNRAGKPIAGATVVLRAKIGGQMLYPTALSHNRDVLARTTTDAAGRFALDKIGIPLRLAGVIESLLREEGGAELLAWSDGMGLAWSNVKGLKAVEPVRLALAPEAKISGLVRDKEGRELAGVRVDGFLHTPRSRDDLDDREARANQLNLTLSEVSFEVRTDAEGRFALRNMPVDHPIGVIFSRPGMARKFVAINTGKESKEKVQSITLEPKRFVRIKVVDEAGKLVDTGAVEIVDSERHFAGKGHVDKTGEAKIALRSIGKLEFYYQTDPLNPRINLRAKANIADGNETPVVEIRLLESRWLSGRVIDADTGKPVAGAHVRYSKTVDEKGESDYVHSIAVSGPDGQFRVPVVAGKGSLWFGFTAVYGYWPGSSLKIDVPKAGEPATVTFPIARGLVIRGVVRDQDGKPVPGATITGTQNEDEYRSHDRFARADAEGRFEMVGLSPCEKAVLEVRGAHGVGEAIVAAIKDHPKDKTRRVALEICLKLGAVVTGRVLYDGKPRAGVKITLYRHDRGKDSASWCGDGKTDAKGEYRITGLEPGDEFYVSTVTDPDGLLMYLPRNDERLHGTVRKGQTEIRLSDTTLVKAAQSLRGIVVDPQGKPVAGASVGASLADGTSIPRQAKGPPPWTETGKDGRFELSGLPGFPIRLMAYIHNGKGGPIHYPAYASPKQEQQDIRIVLDPTLDQEIEDLDAPKGAKTPKK